MSLDGEHKNDDHIIILAVVIRKLDNLRWPEIDRHLKRMDKMLKQVCSNAANLFAVSVI
ncbi:MAG: hypothetical protein NPIRA05_09270 [Nitrospirales bacterium]|nr:MAG: hypothetical protein NPIRA05_09270 [Nitrospirales bacterium]